MNDETDKPDYASEKDREERPLEVTNESKDQTKSKDTNDLHKHVENHLDAAFAPANILSMPRQMGLNLVETIQIALKATGTDDPISVHMSQKGKVAFDDAIGNLNPACTKRNLSDC